MAHEKASVVRVSCQWPAPPFLIFLRFCCGKPSVVFRDVPWHFRTLKISICTKNSAFRAVGSTTVQMGHGPAHSLAANDCGVHEADKQIRTRDGGGVRGLCLPRPFPRDPGRGARPKRVSTRGKWDFKTQDDMHQFMKLTLLCHATLAFPLPSRMLVRADYMCICVCTRVCYVRACIVHVHVYDVRYTRTCIVRVFCVHTCSTSTQCAYVSHVDHGPYSDPPPVPAVLTTQHLLR